MSKNIWNKLKYCRYEGIQGFRRGEWLWNIGKSAYSFQASLGRDCTTEASHIRCLALEQNMNRAMKNEMHKCTWK